MVPMSTLEITRLPTNVDGSSYEPLDNDCADFESTEGASSIRLLHDLREVAARGGLTACEPHLKLSCLLRGRTRLMYTWGSEYGI